MLMAANLKAEFVWRTFMKAGEIAAAMKSVGLNPAAENPSVPQSGGGMHKMLPHLKTFVNDLAWVDPNGQLFSCTQNTSVLK